MHQNLHGKPNWLSQSLDAWRNAAAKTELNILIKLLYNERSNSQQITLELASFIGDSHVDECALPGNLFRVSIAAC